MSAYPPPSGPSPTSPWWYPSTVFPPALYQFPNERFNIFLQQFGVPVFWMKGHLCACIDDDTEFSPSGIDVKQKGSPSPYCQTCGGRGIYWENAQGPYLIAFQYPKLFDVQGTSIDSVLGILENGIVPIIIPSNAQPMWQEINTYDAVVAQGTDMRFHSSLRVGYEETLPYFWNVNVNTSGVTIYDSANTKTVPVPPENVVINGDKVTITGYPKGTSYVVDYMAWPIYVVFGNMGGMTQPFPLLNNLTYPRMTVVKLLDLWTREGFGNLAQSTPQNPPVNAP